MTALEQLKSIVATRTRRLVLWTGAGLSVSAGIPTWPMLQRLLETRLNEKRRDLGDSKPQRDHKIKAIRQESNPWVAFQRLQGELGLTSYREAIREVFAKSSTVDIPEVYHSAWSLRPSGLINLNLDRLATRSFAASGLTGLIEFKGKDIGGHAYTLNSPRPFICNVHGVEDDVESWVFTHDSLKLLAEMPPYHAYFTALLASTTVLFLGISADDTAVGGHLERIEKYGLRTNAHFWITDRQDGAGDAWAERNNVRIIRYRPTSSSHPELNKILQELADYVQPEEISSPPVSLALSLTDNGISNVAELVLKDPEQIRSELNAHASSLLNSAGEDAVENYEIFSKEYDRAIHSAWYTSIEAGQNRFLGYNLVEEVARGAFGLVFKAVDADGSDVAIKLLHGEIRRNRELLHAFRRGVRSLSIIESHALPGVVGFVDATEIPAALIMKWVDGPNLNDVVSSNTLIDWSKIIDIAFQLTNVIAQAHALPERVLHRDIRPPNLIISDYWESDSPTLTVLDFDLSWHRGSVEKSVIFGSQLSGYLAPEQIQRKAGVSTQHASVDSYGIGMTVFYMVSGRDPFPGEHAHSNWYETLSQVVQRPRGQLWKSLPRRVARLIFSATQEHQVKRWDVVQLRSELTALRQAQMESYSVQSAEMIAEELAACCPVVADYDWNAESFAVTKDFGTGLYIQLRGDEATKNIELVIRRVAGAADNRGRLGDVISRARDQVRDVLRSRAWTVHGIVGKGSLEVSASIPSEEIVVDLAGHADALARALERTVFN